MSAADATAEAGLEDLSDPELISRVREGDVAAYGQLFSRHVDAANRLATILVGGSDGDDLVSEAFVKVLDVLLGGGGPDVAFRAYLLTAVRRLHIDKVRSQQRVTTTGDLTAYDPGVPFVDPAVAGFEGGAAARAFASLPERWQMVLWHLEVENQKPADIAPLLGISANSVSALAYRAREGLRQAFLNMHSADLVTEDCRETHDLLGGYVRGGLSRRDTSKVEDHLEHCRPCTAVYLELAEVNSSLAGLLGPALLGTAALAYAGAGSTAGGGGLLAFLAHGKELVLAHVPASAAVASVGIAGLVTGIVLWTGSGGDAPRPEAQGAPEAPVSTRSSSPASVPTRSTGGAPGSGRRASTAAGTSPSTTSPTPSGNRAAASDGPGGGATDGTSGTASQQPGSTAQDRPAQASGGGAGAGAGGTGRPPTADVAVQAAAGPVQGGRSTVTVVVTGVPAGQQGQVRIRGSAADFVASGGHGCRRADGATTCAVDGPRTSLVVRATGRQAITLTVSATGPTGFTDPDQGNNSTTATLAASAGPAG